MLLDHIIRDDGEIYSVSHTRRAVSTIKKVFGTFTASENNLLSRNFSGTWRCDPGNFVTGKYTFQPSNCLLTKLREAQAALFDLLDNPAYDCLERGLLFYCQELWLLMDTL